MSDATLAPGNRVSYSRVERASFGRSVRVTSVVTVVEMKLKRVRVQMPSGATRDVKRTQLIPMSFGDENNG